MGDRYELQLNCIYCGAKNKDVWYAPTCHVDTFDCNGCGKKNFIVYDENNIYCKQIEETNLSDVVKGFKSTTNISRTKKEINKMCKEHLRRLKK